jgi:hypothetical protein
LYVFLDIVIYQEPDMPLASFVYTGNFLLYEVPAIFAKILRTISVTFGPRSSKVIVINTELLVPQGVFFHLFASVVSGVIGLVATLPGTKGGAPAYFNALWFVISGLDLISAALYIRVWVTGGSTIRSSALGHPRVPISRGYLFKGVWVGRRPGNASLYDSLEAYKSIPL